MSALQDLSRWIVRDVWYYVILWDVDRLHHSIIPWVIRARQGPLSKDHRGTFSATSFHRRKLHRSGYAGYHLAILRDTWVDTARAGDWKMCFDWRSNIFDRIWICLVWDCPNTSMEHWFGIDCCRWRYRCCSFGGEAWITEVAKAFKGRIIALRASCCFAGVSWKTCWWRQRWL